MNDDLIEAVARALERALGPDFLSYSSYRDCARAALAAIETSEHAIVPVQPTDEMIGTGEYYRSHEGYSMAAAYAAMLSVRPKVLP